MMMLSSPFSPLFASHCRSITAPRFPPSAWQPRQVMMPMPRTMPYRPIVAAIAAAISTDLPAFMKSICQQIRDELTLRDARICEAASPPLPAPRCSPAARDVRRGLSFSTP